VGGSPLDAVVGVAAGVLVFALFVLVSVLLVRALTRLRVPSVSVAVALRGKYFQLGGRVEGFVYAYAWDEGVQCSGVECELVCTEVVVRRRRRYDRELGEWVMDEEEESEELYRGVARVAGPVRLPARVWQPFPFSLEVPPHLPPSTVRAGRRVVWKVRAKVHCGWWPKTAEKEVVVVSPYLLPGAGEVRCPYCGTVYPKELVFCPYCGAPRSKN
jgi:hypothetical protein